MHKTIYVDIDEEITSIVDRIKREIAHDIYLVVPKDAMLVQGIINLKLLKKESEDMDKNLMLVTSDKYAKRVIERAGLEIKEKLNEDKIVKDQNDVEKGELEYQLSQKAAVESFRILGEDKNKDDYLIGSSSFYDDSINKLDGNVPFQPQSSQALIKDDNVFDLGRSDFSRPVNSFNSASPELNQQKSAVLPNQKPRNTNDLLVTPRSLTLSSRHATQIPIKNKPIREIFSRKSNSFSSSDNYKTEHGSGMFEESKAAEFFGKKAGGSIKKDREKFFSRKPQRRSDGGDSLWIVWVVILILIISVLSGWLFFTFPKAEINLYPEEKKISEEISFSAKENVRQVDFQERVIPAKYVELSIAKTFEFEATDEKYSSDSGQAKGMVTIYNKYSSSPQSIVATSRVMSKDKKLFRLVSSVTVPGMNGTEPGKIDAKVIADEPGESFNIGPTSFTIEGFKGGPKYEKFEVISNSEMTGGGSSSDNKKRKVVSERDLERARKEAVDALELDLEKEIMLKLSPDDQFIVNSVDSEISNSRSSAKAGEIADKFEYTIEKKVKLMVFKEKDAITLMTDIIKEQADSGYSLGSDFNVDYTKGIADFTKKELVIHCDAQGAFFPLIDEENIKKGIAGKSQDEMVDFLSNYDEIDKAEVKFYPAWLNQLPVSEDKIVINKR